jgi:hypothetical protein
MLRKEGGLTTVFAATTTAAVDDGDLDDIEMCRALSACSWRVRRSCVREVSSPRTTP